MGTGRRGGVRRLGPYDSPDRPLRRALGVAPVLVDRLRVYQPLRLSVLRTGPRRPPLLLPRDLPDDDARGGPRQADAATASRRGGKLGEEDWPFGRLHP